jgi:hypothetical protein
MGDPVAANSRQSEIPIKECRKLVQHRLLLRRMILNPHFYHQDTKGTKWHQDSIEKRAVTLRVNRIFLATHCSW